MNKYIPQVLADLANSKKFLVALTASIATVLAWRYGLLSQPSAEHMFLVIWPSYLVAQGVADHGVATGVGQVQAAQAQSQGALDKIGPFLEQMVQLYLAKTPEVSDKPANDTDTPAPFQPSIPPVPTKTGGLKMISDCGHPKTNDPHACPAMHDSKPNHCDCCDSCTISCPKNPAAAQKA